MGALKLVLSIIPFLQKEKKIYKNSLLVENTLLCKTAHVPPFELRWRRKGQPTPKK